MTAYLESPNHRYKRYGLDYGYDMPSAIIVADSVDDAVLLARIEAMRTKRQVRLTDYAVRHVATIESDGQLGYNGAITRYNETEK